ncbi:MAG: PAS domain S-box protein, partial [Proteobacteria bacterium]
MNSSGNDDKSNGAESASRLPDVVLSRADALLFDASLDAMLVVDCASGSIVRANVSVERLLGYPAGALSGKPFTVLFPADAQSSAESTANEILVHDMVFRQDFRRVDGTLVRLDLTAVMLSPGGHDCIFATLRDTRERDDQERHMVQAARTDAFTGLYSRAELLRRLELASQRSLRYRLPSS